jgi:hypothetical protein
MKTQKTGGVLFALLLAAIAMVPVVNAADTNKNAMNGEEELATVNIDFHDQLIRDFGSGYTPLIRPGQYKSESGVSLLGVIDSNTCMVSSAGNYFTLTIMDCQVPPSDTCIPPSGSGMYLTYPEIAVP